MGELLHASKKCALQIMMHKYLNEKAIYSLNCSYLNCNLIIIVQKTTIFYITLAKFIDVSLKDRRLFCQ